MLFKFTWQDTNNTYVHDFFSGYRGRHYLNQSGSKKNGGSVRPVKKKNEIVDDELEGENVKEGGNASGK